jgi:iron complex outermembrane receptor protein
MRVIGERARVGMALAALAAAVGWMGASPVGAAEDPPAVEDRESAEEDRGDPSGAGRSEGEPGRFEESVDVRSRAPWLEDLAAFATTLEADDAARRGLDVGDLLPRVPGARVSSYGGVGQFATVSLRGSSADQVTVRVDGVPQNRALGGAVDLSALPASQIETITVFRGFPPASAGLSGLGGLVDIRTRRPGGGQSAQVDVIAGSLGTRKLSASWSGGVGDDEGSVRLGVEALESEGDFRFVSDNGTSADRSDDFWAERINNDVQAVDLVASASGLRSLGAQMTVSARFRDADRGIPGVEALQSPTTRLDEQRASVHASWQWRGEGGPTGEGATTELLVDGFTQKDHLTDDGPVGVGAGFQDQTTRLSGGGVAVTHRRALGGHRLLGRLELRGERARVRDEVLEPEDRGGARRWTAAAVIEDVFSLGGWTFAPAVRWERQDDAFVPAPHVPAAPRRDAVRASHWSGKLGVARSLGGGWSLRASAGRYVRIPSLVELFGDRGLVVGNPNLMPESGDKVELGVESAPASGRRGRSWQLSLVAFGSWTDDLILFVPTGLGTVKAQNIAASRILGLEAQASWRVSPGLRVEASGTWQRPRDVSGGFAHDRQLVGVPERMGYLGVRWRPGRWRIDYDLTYVGENGSDRLDTQWLRLPARVMHDVSVGREIGDGVTVGIEVRNLLDQQARDVLRFPLPGRMVLARIGWRLGEGR